MTGEWSISVMAAEEDKRMKKKLLNICFRSRRYLQKQVSVWQTTFARLIELACKNLHELSGFERVGSCWIYCGYIWGRITLETGWDQSYEVIPITVFVYFFLILLRISTFNMKTAIFDNPSGNLFARWFEISSVINLMFVNSFIFCDFFYSKFVNFLGNKQFRRQFLWKFFWQSFCKFVLSFLWHLFVNYLEIYLEIFRWFLFFTLGFFF